VNRRILFALFLLFTLACREVYPVKDLHPSGAPDISRLILKNGHVVKFNTDFGWYNRRAGTIEGMTDSNTHVEYHLLEVNRVETVRGYSIFPAIIVGGMILGVGIWLVEKLLTLF
jgi:hypothetical protein